MWNRQIISKLYKSTVVPVTYCTVGLSVYSRGYSDIIDIILHRPKLSIFKYTCSIIESSLWGYCIGITYPIGIPATIGYLYVTRHKDY